MPPCGRLRLAIGLTPERPHALIRRFLAAAGGKGDSTPLRGGGHVEYHPLHGTYEPRIRML